MSIVYSGFHLQIPATRIAQFSSKTFQNHSILPQKKAKRKAMKKGPAAEDFSNSASAMANSMAQGDHLEPLGHPLGCAGPRLVGRGPHAIHAA